MNGNRPQLRFILFLVDKMNKIGKIIRYINCDVSTNDVLQFYLYQGVIPVYHSCINLVKSTSGCLQFRVASVDVSTVSGR